MTDERPDDAVAEIEAGPEPAFVVIATTMEAEVVGPPPPTTPPIRTIAPEDLEALEGRLLGRLAPLAEIARKVDQVQASLDREGRAEATREKVVDRLHAELQDYKQDFLLKVMRPVFLDLVQLHDDMGKRIEAQADPDGEVSRALTDYQQGIADALYRQGVEPYYVDSEDFDPRRQRAIQTVATEDPELNKKVAARHRPGFTSGDKVIRPEIVSVYAFKK